MYAPSLLGLFCCLRACPCPAIPVPVPVPVPARKAKMRSLVLKFSLGFPPCFLFFCFLPFRPIGERERGRVGGRERAKKRERQTKTEKDADIYIAPLLLAYFE